MFGRMSLVRLRAGTPSFSRTHEGMAISTSNQSRSRRGSALLVLSLVMFGMWGANALAADASSSGNPLPEVVVIGPTPIPGTTMDIDKIPGNVQVLSSSDLSREGSPSLTGAPEAADADRAYALFMEHEPDVIVLDLSMPGVSGLDAIRRIIARKPSAKILVFSMHEDAFLAERAIQLGARG
jgi:CheY-like chemotaxis protein